jgi:hypothetical protein
MGGRLAFFLPVGVGIAAQLPDPGMHRRGGDRRVLPLRGLRQLFPDGGEQLFAAAGIDAGEPGGVAGLAYEAAGTFGFGFHRRDYNPLRWCKTVGDHAPAAQLQEYCLCL